MAAGTYDGGGDIMMGWDKLCWCASMDMSGRGSDLPPGLYQTDLPIIPKYSMDQICIDPSVFKNPPSAMNISAQYQDQRKFNPDMDKQFAAQFEKKKYRIPVISWLIEKLKWVKEI